MGHGAGIGRRLLLMVVTFAMAACADLGGVRDFALLSTSFTGSSDLSARWRDTESRLKAISLPGDVPLEISTGLVQLAKIYRPDLANERKLVRDRAALQTSGTGSTPADSLLRRFVTDLAGAATAIPSGQPAAIATALASLQQTVASVQGE
jgi:hypothetical protein